MSANTINFGALKYAYGQNPKGYIERIQSGEEQIPLIQGVQKPRNINSSIEINCKNYTPELLTSFIQSCYPDDVTRQRKLSYLVRFYLFKGECYKTTNKVKSMFSREISGEPTRRIIKENDGYTIIGGNYKMEFKLPSFSKEVVKIQDRVFNTLVDLTPFASYTIFKKLFEMFRTPESLNDINDESLKAIVLDVICKNVPHISKIDYLKNLGIMATDQALLTVVSAVYNVLLFAVAFIPFHLMLISGKDVEKLSSKLFTERQINFAIQHRADHITSDVNSIKMNNILKMIQIYTNVILFISYRSHFEGFKILSKKERIFGNNTEYRIKKEREMNEFINTYFSETDLNETGDGKFKELVNKLIALNNPLDTLMKLTNLVKLKLETGVPQRAGKKQSKKRLVDCTVKELKEKMKKKGKKLSKDGVPLTKSQLIKALKK